MAKIQPPTAAEAPAIVRQAAHLLRRLEKWARDSGARDAPIWSDVIQFLAKHDPPAPPGPIWACPSCGSQEIQALAWVTLNGEVIEDYDEGTEYWCPRCERHYKRVCRVNQEGQCHLHERPFAKCRDQETANRIL